MTPCVKPCGDCPWFEPGGREDMIALLESGEKNWPCHNTATFDEGPNGEILNFVEEPRNRLCAGYVQFMTGVAL